MKRLIAIAAWLLVACAAQPATPSAFEPAIGHHQPLPTESPSAVEPASERQEPEPIPWSETSAGAEQPPETESEVSSVLPTAEEEALCRHIVKLVQSESRSQASPEETAELILNCGLALAHDRRRMGVEEFERRAACMFAATQVADFAACTPETAPSEPP